MNAESRHEQAQGIWQLQKEVPVEDDLGKLVNNIYTFIYDNCTVTLRLLTLRSGQWKSEDDFYKLSSQWEADTLYYLPPFGDWVELASFENDHFINIGNGKKRIFQNIQADEVAQWNRDILKQDRPLHDYQIRPDGRKKL